MKRLRSTIAGTVLYAAVWALSWAVHYLTSTKDRS